MNNRLIVPIGVLIAAVLIIAGGYMIFNDSSKTSDDSGYEDDDDVVEYTAREAFMPEIKVKSDELTRNAPVPFKVGEKYKYRSTRQHTFTRYDPDDYEETEEVIMDRETGEPRMITRTRPKEDAKEINETRTDTAEIEFFVENMEKAEGRDCYAVSVKVREEISKEEKSEMRKYMSEEEMAGEIREREELMEQQKILFYYDKDTGKTTQVKMDMGGGEEMTFKDDFAEFIATAALGEMTGGSMFSGWMLSLNENFRWKQEIEIAEKFGSGEKHSGKITMEYRVVDMEKTDGRECFKVEIVGRMEEDEQESFPDESDKIEMTLWVDVDKRIMVKQQTKQGNFMTTETNLVEII
ncbi:MAG: hypothetical protein A7315_12420 [Candidatus Altiarchaeales archaeon WOR_SM1_79]|nr:MAG: hypothetical protein A7315_12420 [Candidatus Altiarchaeales archaeon WOR_SM1_79]